MILGIMSGVVLNFIISIRKLWGKGDDGNCVTAPFLLRFVIFTREKELVCRIFTIFAAAKPRLSESRAKFTSTMPSGSRFERTSNHQKRLYYERETETS